MTAVLYDSRWIGNHGIGRFASELQKSIPGLMPFQARWQPWDALDPALLGIALWRLKPKLFFSPGYNSPVGWTGTYVFTLHDLHHLCVPEDSNAAKRAYYRFVIRPACHRASFVLTVSEYSRHEICEWAGTNEERVVNVGNGVGFPFTSSGDVYNPGYPYLLYVGSHKPHKNLVRLFRAYSAAGLCQDVRLLLSGMANPELMTEIQRLGLGQEVVFIGSQSNSELSAIYRGALGFVFPSLYEGFGLPPLEAMACGVPVLTSNICSLPEIVGDAAILVDPLDIEQIANGIRTLVYDSTLRCRLRKRGLERAQQYTWDKTAADTQKVLQVALQS